MTSARVVLGLIVVAAGLLVAVLANGSARSRAAKDEPQGLIHRIQREIFKPACRECHGGIFRHSGLDLSSARSSWLALVDRESECPDKMLVVPGEPDESYLIEKLGSSPTCGATMPPPGEKAIDDRQIGLVIRWIEAGAKMSATRK